MLENLVDQLSNELDLNKQITSKNNGIFAIQFDENNQIQLSTTPESFLIATTIAALPSPSEAFVQFAMEGNLFGMGTKRAVLGLDEEGKLLTLTDELPYNVSYKEFKERIEDFLNIADFWRNKIQKV